MPLQNETASKNSRSVGKAIGRHFALFVSAVITFPVFVYLRAPQYGKVSAMMAWLVLGIAVLSWTRWESHNRIPFLQIILSFYAVYFSFPVFFPLEMRLLYARYVASEEHLRQTMGLVLLTQCSIWAGWSVAKRFIPRREMRLDVSDTRLLIYAVAVIVFQVVLFILKQRNPDLELGGYIQVINGVANIYLAIGIFYYLGERKGWNAVYISGIVVASLFQLAISINSAMVGDAIMPILVLGVLAFQKHARLTVLFLITLIGIGIVTQPVKHLYRIALQQRREVGIDVSFADKVQLYIVLLRSYWFQPRAVSYFEESPELQFSRRLSLVPIVAVIVKETPARIPYQLGWTFRYLVFTPLPRFLYPQKPTAQEANVWFARSYHILDERLAKTTMVGISQLGEVYVNFGWAGVPFVFFFFGVVLYLLSFLDTGVGGRLAPKAMLAALLPNFFAVESTLTGFIAGTLYTFVLTYLVLRLLSRSRL
ncbi:MAG: hypothetical protein QHI48_07595 [Bacteroidota bacterium]|nr:hypothetical protein [Bacteroidota bacterium]